MPLLVSGGVYNCEEKCKNFCIIKAEVVCRQRHEKGYTVCGLAWHPSGGQLAYTDTEGCLGLLDGLCTSTSKTKVLPKYHVYVYTP